MSKLSILVDKVKELQAQIKADGKDALAEAFRDFFSANPLARALVWTQYTPYFNDGDACVFSVGEICLKLDADKAAPDVQLALGYEAIEASEEDEEDEDQDEDAYECESGILQELDSNRGEASSWSVIGQKKIPQRKLTAEETQLLEQFDALSGQLGTVEEVLETVLGDHVKVIATIDGIETEEWDHD